MITLGFAIISNAYNWAMLEISAKNIFEGTVFCKWWSWWIYLNFQTSNRWSELEGEHSCGYQVFADFQFSDDTKAIVEVTD